MDAEPDGVRRLSLLGRFALMSIVPFAALGLVLAHTLEDAITQRTLATAREGAQLTSRLAIQPYVSAEDLQSGVPRERLRSLDAALRSAAGEEELARVRIWNRESQLVSAHDRGQLGLTSPSENLQRALGGRISSEVGQVSDYPDEREQGKLLQVYVPLVFTAGERPAGALELYLPYAPIARAIEHDTRKLYVMLAIGLAILYAALFRIVAGASRTLSRQAAANEHLALHDALTALPNRALLQERIEAALAARGVEGPELAVMILDLDRFKEINDTLGHHTGDILLQQVGARLRGALRKRDTVARLGGDEFAILLPEISDRADGLMERVREVVEKPFILHGLTLHLTASVGIAFSPEHGDDVDVLLQRADVAMYVAKETRSGCHVYTTESDRHSPSRLALGADLRRAIAQGELFLHYQPKVSLQALTTDTVEALVRWQHPERGLIAPNEFIPLAEGTGLIRPLTLAVLDQALSQCRAWEDAGTTLNVAVNLSVLNLLDEKLPEDVARLLNKRGVLPSSLELEITESTIMSDPERGLNVLEKLNAMGVSLAIDDYGTGHSSLAYLRRLPVQEVKIDRAFVTHMDSSESDAMIVRSTIELGHNLGLRVVAEGIETAEVMAELTRLGCDLAQGYFLSPPLTAEELERWLRTPVRSAPAKTPLGT